MCWFPEVPSNLKAFFFFFFFFSLSTILAFHQEETLYEMLRCVQLAYLWSWAIFALQMRQTACIVTLGVLPVLIGFAMPSTAGSAVWKRNKRRDSYPGSLSMFKYDPALKLDLKSFHCVPWGQQSLTHREPAPCATDHMDPIEPHRSVRGWHGGHSSGTLCTHPDIILGHQSSLPYFSNVDNLHIWHSQQLSQHGEKCVWFLSGLFWKHKPCKHHSVACKAWREWERVGLDTLESRWPSLGRQ